MQNPAVEAEFRTNVTATVAAAAGVSSDNVTINNITAAGTAVLRRSVLRTSVTRALLQSSSGVQVRLLSPRVVNERRQRSAHRRV